MDTYNSFMLLNRPFFNFLVCFQVLTHKANFLLFFPSPLLFSFPLKLPLFYFSPFSPCRLLLRCPPPVLTSALEQQLHKKSCFSGAISGCCHLPGFISISNKLSVQFHLSFGGTAAPKCLVITGVQHTPVAKYIKEIGEKSYIFPACQPLNRLVRKQGLLSLCMQIFIL